MAGEAVNGVDPRDMAPQEADIPEEEVITLEVVTEGEVITAVAAGVVARILRRLQEWWRRQRMERSPPLLIAQRTRDDVAHISM